MLRSRIQFVILTFRYNGNTKVCCIKHHIRIVLKLRAIIGQCHCSYNLKLLSAKNNRIPDF